MIWTLNSFRAWPIKLQLSNHVSHARCHTTMNMMWGYTLHVIGHLELYFNWSFIIYVRPIPDDEPRPHFAGKICIV